MPRPSERVSGDVRRPRAGGRYLDVRRRLPLVGTPARALWLRGRRRPPAAPSLPSAPPKASPTARKLPHAQARPHTPAAPQVGVGRARRHGAGYPCHHCAGRAADVWRQEQPERRAGGDPTGQPAWGSMGQREAVWGSRHGAAWGRSVRGVCVASLPLRQAQAWPRPPAPRPAPPQAFKVGGAAGRWLPSGRVAAGGATAAWQGPATVGLAPHKAASAPVARPSAVPPRPALTSHPTRHPRPQAGPGTVWPS
jgi:hypothetical protein